MSPEEFARRLGALPVEKPDDTDRTMLAAAAAEDDGTAVELEAFMASFRRRDPGTITGRQTAAY